MENDYLDNDLANDEFVEYASFGERFLASLLDFLIVMIPIILLNMYFMSNQLTILVLAVVIISILYKPVTEGMFGATFGKMIMKLKVVDDDNEQIGLNQSFMKNLIYVIPGLISLYTTFLFTGTEEYLDAEGFMEISQAQQATADQTLGMISIVFVVLQLISCLYMLGNDRKQTVHDLVGKTYLIKK